MIVSISIGRVKQSLFVNNRINNINKLNNIYLTKRMGNVPITIHFTCCPRNEHDCTDGGLRRNIFRRFIERCRNRNRTDCPNNLDNHNPSHSDI